MPRRATGEVADGDVRGLRGGDAAVGVVSTRDREPERTKMSKAAAERRPGGAAGQLFLRLVSAPLEKAFRWRWV
jgi:hypothetical protein